MVWGVPRVRSDLTALRDLRIDTPAGAQVRLGDVCDVGIVAAPNIIQHEGASRRLDITCNVAGRDLGSVAREIKALVSDPNKITFDRGYHPEFLGEYAARAESQRRLFVLAAMSLPPALWSGHAVASVCAILMLPAAIFVS